MWGAGPSTRLSRSEAQKTHIPEPAPCHISRKPDISTSNSDSSRICSKPPRPADLFRHAANQQVIDRPGDRILYRSHSARAADPLQESGERIAIRTAALLIVVSAFERQHARV